MRARVLVLPSLLAATLLACGDGPIPPSTGGPTAPPVPTGPAAYDGDLDSLFGAAAPRIVAAIGGQRAALAAAAEEALAGAADAAPASLATAGRAAARAVAAGTAQPLPIHYRDTRAEVVDQATAPSEVTTTTTLDAQVTDGTLSVVGTERVVVRALAGDATMRRRSMVGETRLQLDVATCPDPTGLAAGRWSSSVRTWSTRGDTALAGPTAHDALTEELAEGTTAAHVDDRAETESFDVDVRIAIRKARLPGNRPIDKRGGVRLRRTGVVPADLIRHWNGAMFGEQTGDFDLLNTIGLGPQELYVRIMQRMRATYGRARGVWRGGACVEVVPARGATGGPLAPGSTVDLGPEARHRVDGATVVPATLDAVATAGTVAAPAAGVPHPATFRFTMPPAGGARVDFTATSRRGIGFGTVAFHEAGAPLGELTNDVSVAYTLDGTIDRDERVTGALAASQQLRSTFRLRLDRRDPDGTLHYDVLAENHIALAGQGQLSSTHPYGSDKVTAAMSGQETTHNPVGPGDRPLNATQVLAPDQRLPSPDAGRLRLWTRNGQHFYELRLNVMQIVPAFTWRHERRERCLANSEGLEVSTYDNLTHAVTVTIDDAKRCLTNPGHSYELGRPYSVGLIASDWSHYDPVTSSNAMVTGRWDPATAAAIAGTRADRHTDCEKVVWMDPTQLGAYARSHSGFWVSWEEHGTCQLGTTLRWSIPVPPEARAAAGVAR